VHVALVLDEARQLLEMVVCAEQRAENGGDKDGVSAMRINKIARAVRRYAHVLEV